MVRSRCSVALLVCLAVFGGFGRIVHAQEPSSPAASSQELRVFLDCQVYCHEEFLRTQLTWISYVRDRRDADVHVLITSDRTGAGGSQITLRFIGLRAYAGQDQQLAYNALPNESDDARRTELLRLLQLGLVPYALKLPSADGLEVSYRRPPARAASPGGAVRDPWNYWVFRTRVNGNFDGESSSQGSSVAANITANRITEAWKFILGTNGNYRRRKYALSDGGTLSTINKRLGVRGAIVKSATQHWSAGVRASRYVDTFANAKNQTVVEGGPEWNLFPYAESTRRQFTFQYMLGVQHFAYYQETLYGKLSERLFSQKLAAALAMVQPWGEANMSFETANYLHDMSKYHVNVDGYAQFRIFRGLSLSISGNVARVHDQLNLQKGDASDEDILIRQRELATSYRYQLSFGLNYTFGSIFNNVVNPRFRDDN